MRAQGLAPATYQAVQQLAPGVAPRRLRVAGLVTSVICAVVALPRVQIGPGL
jgi:hypothetical protein